MKFNQLIEELVLCHKLEIEELQRNIRLENPDNTILEQNNKLRQENEELQQQLQKSNQKIVELKSKLKGLKAQLIQQNTSINGGVSSVDATVDPNIKNSANNMVQEDNDAKDMDTSHDLSDSDGPSKQKLEPSFSFSTLLAKKKSPEPSTTHNNNNQDTPTTPTNFANSNSQPELYSRKKKRPVQFHDDFDMLTQAPNLDMDLVQPTVDTTSNNNNNNSFSNKSQSIQIANTKIVSRYTKKTSITPTSSPFAVPSTPSTKKSKAPNKITPSLPDDEEFSVVDLNDDELQARTSSKPSNANDDASNFLSPTMATTPVKSPNPSTSTKTTPNAKTPSPASNNNHSDNNNTSNSSNGSSVTPKRPIPFIVDLENDEYENEGIPTNGTPNKKFKFVDSVRKKADREALPSHECEECKKFMDAIDGEFKIDRQKMLQYCGRHRQMYAAPETPPDFWEVSFPDTETQDVHQ